ncbi:exported hypothetical protein [Candidatus Terasakiella magnetica]|uniref:Uncharacterized protein n=1 Tax=Candidatus Terasakiella magnetica TaxID=1867952 RepID=A0A1C3RIG6_9PROT|nr:hypothetical protein [Candidatus Terasakiella magnetica]SCA57056.1 exported hypothetical protein [Candidatus Terasakiella magnetica]
MHKKIVLCAFLGLSLFMGASSALANSTSDTLAMLTQRMAKAACFLGTFSEPEKYRTILLESQGQFAQKLQHLEETAPTPIIKLALRKLKPDWANLHFASSILADMPAYPGLDVNMIADFNLPLLAHSKNLSELYNSNTNVQKNASRLSLLSQKAAKEFCLVSYGFNPAQNRKYLSASIREFDQILKQMGAQESLDKADIQAQLKRIKTSWKGNKGVMTAIASFMRARTSDFNVVSSTNENVLSQCRKLEDLIAQNTL